MINIDAVTIENDIIQLRIQEVNRLSPESNLKRIPYHKYNQPTIK